MRVARNAASLAAALVVVALAAVHGQQRPQTGAIRSAVTLVPVDVRVMDRDGRPITGLQASDFTVYEDGVRQDIAHFTADALVPAAPAETGPPLRRVAGLNPAARPLQRTFLIVLGRGRLQDVSKGFDALIDLVENRLLPQDHVALVAYNRATDFTVRRDATLRVLRRLREDHRSIEARLDHHFSGLQLVLGSVDIPPKVQASIDDVFEESEMPARELPPTRVPEESRIDADMSRAREYADPTDGGSLRDLARGHEAYEDLLNLYMAVDYLRFVEGEKHIIFVTEQGMVGLGRSENSNSLAALAADARVAIHTIQTGGLPTSWAGRVFQGRSWAEGWAMHDARAVAETTGGSATFYRYASDAIARIDGSTRHQYALGYSPKNGNWDGKFRRIKVTVRRPGATVLYRRGYFARQELVPYDRQQFLTYNRVMAAGAWGAPLKDIPVTATGKRDSGGGAVDVEITIAASGVTFREEGGYRVATLDVAVFAGGEKNALSGETWQKLDLKLDAAAYDRVTTAGIAHTARVDATMPVRDVKVVVYQYDVDRVGSASSRVQRGVTAK